MDRDTSQNRQDAKAEAFLKMKRRLENANFAENDGRQPSLLAEPAAHRQSVLAEERASQQLQKARICAIQYLSYGAKTSGKVRQHLLKKDFDPDTTREALEELIEEGRIDDLSYIRSFAKLRRAGKSESIQAYTLRMRNLGVAREAIDAYLQEMDVHADNRLRLDEYMQHKQGPTLALLIEQSDCGQQDRRLLSRLVRAAQGRGFALHQIMDYLREHNIELH